MPAGGGHGGGVEQRARVCQGWPDPGCGAEQGRHQGRDLAQPGAGQLARVGLQLAGLVPVDQLQGQRDIAAVLGEGGRLRPVAHRELGVSRAFGHAGQVADRADQRAGDVVAAC